MTALVPRSSFLTVRRADPLSWTDSVSSDALRLRGATDPAIEGSGQGEDVIRIEHVIQYKWNLTFRTFLGRSERIPKV